MSSRNGTPTPGPTTGRSTTSRPSPPGQKWRKRFKYNEAGKCIQEDIYDERNRLNSVKKFEYNEFGRKKTQTTYTPKGKVVSIKHYEYIVSDGK